MNTAAGTVLDVRRTRYRIAPHAVREVATALATGMPVIDMLSGAPDFDRMTSSAISDINQQAGYDEPYRFPQPPLGNIQTIYNTFTADLPAFVGSAHTTAYYLDFVTIGRHGPDVPPSGPRGAHAHAVMWRHYAPSGHLGIPETLPVRSFVAHNIVCASTRTAKDTPGSVYRPDDAAVATHFYTERGVNMDGAVLYFDQLIDVSEVLDQTGPNHTDPIWSSPIPEPGDDISFDTVFASGLHTSYTLRPRREFWETINAN